jgi:hypothetical protein
MKRLLSRHAVVALLVLVTSSLGGLSLAVVAFGQSGGDPDATVPLGDYTGTTPGPGQTVPLSSYTTTTTTQTQTQSATPVQTTGSTTPSRPTTTNGTHPSRSHGRSNVPRTSGPLPSRVTRSGPTHLAFTGGEPIIIGAFGIMLMISGLALQQRRRRSRFAAR